MMQAEKVREEQLNVRLNPTEAAYFTRLAEHFGLTPAAMVRMLVKDKARDLGLLDAPPQRSASERIMADLDAANAHLLPKRRASTSKPSKKR